MTKTMTSYERYKRVYDHKEPDRVPMRDSPWGTTMARWRREGLPQDVGFGEFFGFDRIAGIGCEVGAAREKRAPREEVGYCHPYRDQKRIDYQVDCQLTVDDSFGVAWGLLHGVFCWSVENQCQTRPCVARDGKKDMLPISEKGEVEEEGTKEEDGFS